MARSAAIGAAIGFVLALALTTVIGVESGLKAISAVGLGCFIGVWGGMGFGFMMGGTRAITRYERTHDPHHPHHPG